MRRVKVITHEFAEYIPDKLADDRVYVSIPYATVAHNCFCGCGNEIVTPLGPTDGRLIFDGDSISLEPSIGNWTLPCRSHYWIVNNRVRWAATWPSARIEAAREHDRRAKATYFSQPRNEGSDTLPQRQQQSRTSWQRAIGLVSKWRQHFSQSR
jgi:hypothetical protein